MARPTKYRGDFAGQAEKLCKLGGVDTELADFFGVSVFTINKWKRAHKEFRLALIAGKQVADAQVAERLYQRACGYSHPAVKIFQCEGEIIEAPYLKQYAPDTVACIFWLKNRRPDVWRDRHETEVTGKGGAPIAISWPLPKQNLISDMDLDQRYIIQNALSMEVFAEEAPTFKYGEWKAWRQACLTEGRAIPPTEYKKPKTLLDE